MRFVRPSLILKCQLLASLRFAHTSNSSMVVVEIHNLVTAVSKTVIVEAFSAKVSTSIVGSSAFKRLIIKLASDEPY